MNAMDGTEDDTLWLDGEEDNIVPVRIVLCNVFTPTRKMLDF